MGEYYKLLSSLATDLDNMLSELCTTPPPPYNHLELERNESFLEPYLQCRQTPPTTPSPPPRLLPPSPPSPSLSSNGGSDAGSENSSASDYSATCEISLIERLSRSHPIWFLPGIQRAGAVHLLQGKEEGCFVVRQSSLPHTMALSVRLPARKGPYIEHYLIQSSEGNRVGLETSDNRFDSIPKLIEHYANCCDELPVQLTLPKAIREARSFQQLQSMAHLGQEFWRYSPPPSAASSPDADLVLNLNPLMSTFKVAEPSTPTAKLVRPSTLNLMLERQVKTPPLPPPRFSKPTTPNFTVTTTVTFSVNAAQQSPVCEGEKRMSPEGHSTISSKGSLKHEVLSPIVLSPLGSDPSSLLSDTLSPLSMTKAVRVSKRRQKVSKHYQESDIVDSPTILYHTSGLGDKISDYEDLWTENGLAKASLASPDLLQSHQIGASQALSPTEEEGQAVKQGSPFYAEPADSLSQQVAKRVQRGSYPLQQRHSNPAGLTSHSPLSPGLERVESGEFCGLMSSSVDNLSPKQRLRKPEIKVVLPPSIRPKISDTWQVDKEWTFRTENDDRMEMSDPDYDSDWPTIPNVISSIKPYSCNPDDRTVQEMISKNFPDIRTSSDLTSDEEQCRMSAYDNVDERRPPRPPPSEISELTEFSDPWTEVGDDSFNCSKVNRSKSFKDRLDPLLAAPRLKALQQSGTKAVGATIRSYALELAQDKNTTFAQNIDNFIECTCRSKETNPTIIMRNMRQFMSGMKNYLVKHGEKDFNTEIERERSKLKPTEFLNLDAILEGVMHKLVVKPLKSHLHKLFLDYYTKSGAIRLLADNIQFASTRPISELAIKPKIHLPTESSLNTISKYIQSLQAADSPLEKLEYLLAAIATIFNSVKMGQLGGKSAQLGADDFLPLFVWVLVKTNFVAAEIEADYMWGLLHPSLLSGEGGYYLTTLSSAIHVLKTFKVGSEESAKSGVKNDSVLKVVVPNELHGSILTKTLPAKPNMTTKDVCSIIAHKARITNPQDYALYRVTDGEETMLMDNEHPQDFISGVRHTMLAYKRTDAKIAWPNQAKLNL